MARPQAALQIGRPKPFVNPYRNIKRIFVISGLVLLVIAGYEYEGMRRFLAGADVAEGTVITAKHRADATGGEDHTVVVRFTTNRGRVIDFRPPLLTNPESYKEGGKVKVYYMSSDPRNARTDVWGYVVFKAALGVILLIAAGGMTIMTQRKMRHAQSLRSRGRQLVTRVQEIELNKNLSIGGVNPYIIRSQWEDPSTGKTYFFKSDNLWFNPTDFVAGRTVPVYMSSDDPEDYSMDLSFLPKDLHYTSPQVEKRKVPVPVPKRERKLGLFGKIAFVLLAVIVLQIAVSMWKSDPKAAIVGYFMLSFVGFFIAAVIITVLNLSRILGFRCPKCHTRISKPIDDEGKEDVPICFYCEKCDIIWDSGVRTSSSL